MKSWLQGNPFEFYSTHNKKKSKHNEVIVDKYNDT